MAETTLVRDRDAFPTQQLAILAICRFSEPIAFNSILAYTYIMTVDLHHGDDTDASFYAGLLVSAYAVAEALTAVMWGTISDRYGRKPVVLIGLAGVALSSLIFGLAQRYWVALLARFVGGALNGNVAVMQTMVTEMVKKEEHEPKAYAIQPSVWSLGAIIGSAIGGYLTQPAQFYPSLFSADGLFGRYPYLLPNLIAMAVITIAIIQGLVFLEETNPCKDANDCAIDDAVDEATPLIHHQKRFAANITKAIQKKASFIEEGLPVPVDTTFDLRRASFGPVRSTNAPTHFRPDEVCSPHSIVNKSIVTVTLALVLQAYHSMAYFSIFPIWVQDVPTAVSGRLDFAGGLGYTVHDVGTYMTVNGIIALSIQGVVFPLFVRKFGVWKSFVLTAVLYPVCYLGMPFISALPEALISPGIYVSLLLQNFFGIILVPCALIMLKNAVLSPSVLGKVNGLAMSGCCLARTISPPLVGIIYGVGSAAAWFSCAGVAALGTFQLFSVPRQCAESARTERRSDEEESHAAST